MIKTLFKENEFYEEDFNIKDNNQINNNYEFVLGNSIPKSSLCNFLTDNIIDISTKNKNLIISQIINLFSLIVNSNTDVMLNQFIKFYYFLTTSNCDNMSLIDKEIKDSNEDKIFTNFIDNCLPILKNSKNIRPYVKMFLPEEYLRIKEFEKNIIENIPHNLNWTIKITNFNDYFESKSNQDDDFIYYLIVAFSVNENLDIQRNILNLIYNIFNQRKNLFTNIFEISGVKIQNIKDTTSESIIEKILLKFYFNYEKQKSLPNSEVNIKLFNEFLKYLIPNIIELFNDFFTKLYDIINESLEFYNRTSVYKLTKKNVIDKDEKTDIELCKNIKKILNFIEKIRINKDKNQTLSNYNTLLSLNYLLMEFTRLNMKNKHIKYICKFQKVKLLEKHILSLIKDLIYKANSILLN